MSASKKRRFIIVGGIIVVVVVLAIAFLSAGTTATVMSVAEAASPDAVGKKVQVEGTVVNDSYSIEGDTLTFSIVDTSDSSSDSSEAGTNNAQQKDNNAQSGSSAKTEKTNQSPMLTVIYDKSIGATFGNGVVAICTGTIEEVGVLRASELVTKCPSKYETSTDALTITSMYNYGEGIIGKPIKVKGSLKLASVADVRSDVRFVLYDEDGTPLQVIYDGALPESLTDGQGLVLTGALNHDGAFEATDVALEEGR